MLSSLALSPPSRPKLLRPRKNKCRVVWHSHHRDAQNNYDLEKINVECVKWSGPPHHRDAQNKYNLEK
jgi:hypothetical protein